MTLPKAPPLRRFHMPPPAPRRAGATGRRLQRMVREHEEEEKPFEPGRAPTWKGSSKDLVVNASGFEKDLRELVERYHPKLKASRHMTVGQMQYALRKAFQEQDTDSALEFANDLLEGFGIESVGGGDQHSGPRYLYINFGDTYDPTIAWSRDDNKVFVAMGGWGDLAEANEASAFDEGWDGWRSSDFQSGVLSELEATAETLGAGSKAYKGIEATAEFFEGLDSDQSKELFRRATSRASGVGGKYPEVIEESDGSIFVRHLDVVVQEAADMLAEGWSPGKWEGHSTRKGGHTPNSAKVWEAWDDNNHFLGAAGSREEAREIRRAYLRKKYGEEPDLEFVDQGVADTRREDDETVSYGRNASKRRTRVGPDTYPRSRFQVGDIVYPRFVIQGAPTSIGRDTRCVVSEVRPRDKRMRVERDDRRPGSWWVSFDDMRKQGEPVG